MIQGHFNMKKILFTLIATIGLAECVSTGPILYIDTEKFHKSEPAVYFNEKLAESQCRYHELLNVLNATRSILMSVSPRTDAVSAQIEQIDQNIREANEQQQLIYKKYDLDLVKQRALFLEKLIAENYKATAIVVIGRRVQHVVYINPENDISDEVVAALNEDFRVNKHLYIHNQ